MKKIMLTFAIIAMSVAANAASFKWTAAGVYDSTLTSTYTGTATLYAYLSTDDASTATSVAVANIVNGAVKADDLTTTGYTFSSDSLIGGNEYNFYMVVVDGDKSFTSTTKENVTAQALTTVTVGFGNLKTATQDASNWVAVPEPTSGLLLLLGMAGLALRRKRA